MFSNWKLLGSVQVKYSRSPNWICKVTNLSSIVAHCLLGINKKMRHSNTTVDSSGGDRQTD